MSNNNNLFATPKNDDTHESVDEESLVKIAHHLAKWFNAGGTILLALSVYLFSQPVEDATLIYYLRLIIFIVGIGLMVVTFMLKPSVVSKEEALHIYQERAASRKVRRPVLFPACVIIVTLVIAILLLLGE